MRSVLCLSRRELDVLLVVDFSWLALGGHRPRLNCIGSRRMNILRNKFPTICNRVDRVRVLIQNIDLLERESLGLRNEED